MAVDRAKILEAAQKHLAKGNVDRAIAEYEKLIQADPNDVRTLLNVGHLYAKKGAHREASEVFRKAAHLYTAQGFLSKAVAVYKQAIQLQPSRIDLLELLAKTYEKLQLTSDAVQTYDQIVASYVRDNQIDDALRVLKAMVELEPENVPVRIKYAEALSRANKLEAAAHEFDAGGAILEKQGRIDDYLKVADRLYFHRPDDIGLAQKLARMYLSRKDPKRALTKLQACYKNDATHIPTLELLAEAFRDLGQDSKRVTVYREIARVHEAAGRKDARDAALKKILELDPQDAEAKASLRPPPAKMVPEPSKPSVRVDAMPPGAIVGSPSPKPAPPPLAAQRVPPPPARPATSPAVPVPPPIRPPTSPGLAVPPPIRPPTSPAITAPPLPGARAGVPPKAPISRPAAEPAATFRSTSPQTPSTPTGRSSFEEIEPESVRPSDPHGLLTVDRDIDVDYDDQPQSPSAAPAHEPLEQEAVVARLIAEAAGFARFKLVSKAIYALEEAVSLLPGHIEANEQLKELLVAQGRHGDAATVLENLSRTLHSRPELEKLFAREAARIREAGAPVVEATAPGIDFADDTNTDPGKVVQEDEIFFVEPSNVAPLPEDPKFADDFDFSDATVMSTDFDEGIPASPSAFALPEIEPEPFAPAEPADLRRFDTPIPSGEPVSARLDRFDTPVPQAPPLPPSESLPVAPAILAQLEQPVLDDFHPDDVVSMSEDSLPEHVQAALERSKRPPGEIEEALDEVDFFIAQGLFDAARASLTDALSAHPGHPLLRDKLEEIEELSAPSVSRIPLFASSEDAFALAEKLAEEIDEAGGDYVESGQKMIDVDEVFKQFKKGVEAQIGLEDSDTHFDLGIAYKEMHLFEDAIREFEIAGRNPQRECTCFAMIGLCFIDQNKYTDAVSQFKRGLYCDIKTDDEEIALYYELGAAYEELKDPREAIYYFQKVQKRIPDYRDIAARLDRLQNPGTDSKKSVSTPDADEVDAAFDQLLGGD